MRNVKGNVLFFCVLFLSGCGKYGPPMPPETLAPRPVKALEAEANLEGVKISWRAPEADLRGRELKSMDGYKVERKVVDTEASEEQPEFEELTLIADQHVIQREILREQARAENKPTHRVKVEDALKQFSYLDGQVENGKTYIYRIVPINQGDVEGRYTQLVKVLFNGESSEVFVLGNVAEEPASEMFEEDSY
ncbi:MAG: hypothetical protein KDD42_07340 [Bdellovibrionales bacterium]|nr:hypothetical protein [Bdellovibrionales bacterium]